jgi:oligoribonuclease
MTGLDIDNDVIIEIFCIITNGNLDVMDESGWGTVIHQSKERMDKMVPLCDSSCPATTKQHRTSGVLGPMARMA